MKLRTPGTLSAAISEIRHKLSEQKCAEIVDRSESLVRKWADPDDPALPNLRQSLLLDAAYIHAGFGEPPIQNWYVNRLDGLITDDPENAVNVIAATLHAQSALGQIASTVAQFTADGSDHGEELSSNERAVLLGMVEGLSVQLDLLEGSLQEHFDMRGPISMSKLTAK